MTRSKSSFVRRAQRGSRSGGVCRSSRAHIIGVSVSDTTAEIRIDTASVIANSRNRRPTTSPMNSSGISTAISENVSEMIVKPICSAPFSAACERLLAAFDVARDVLDHHDRVVDDEAGRDRQRHQREVVDREAGEVHHAERADERQRHRDARDDRRRHVAQEHEDHHHDQHDRRGSARTARRRPTRGSSSCGRSAARPRPTPGSDACSCGSSCLMRSTTSMTFAPGWRWMLTMIAGLSFAHAARRTFSAPSTTSATSDSRIGAPFLYAMIMLLVLVGRTQLVVRVDRRGARRTVEAALRLVRVRVRDRGAHVVEREAERRERRRVDLDAHRRPLAAATG